MSELSLLGVALVSYRRGASDVTDVALVSWITSKNLPDPLISLASLSCGASDVDNVSYEQGYQLNEARLTLYLNKP